MSQATTEVWVSIRRVLGFRLYGGCHSGIVNPSDTTIRMLAEAANVSKELNAATIAEVLCTEFTDDDMESDLKRAVWPCFS